MSMADFEMWLRFFMDCAVIIFPQIQNYSKDSALTAANSSLVTDPSQNWLQTVNYLSQLLLWLISCLSFDLLTAYTPFRQLRSSADTQILCIPHVRSKTLGKPCPKAMEFTPFWHLSHSVLLCLQNCFKTSPLWIIPQVISNSVFLLASPPPLDSITPCYSPFVHLCVCVCARVQVWCARNLHSIMTIIFIYIYAHAHTHTVTHTHTHTHTSPSAATATTETKYHWERSYWLHFQRVDFRMPIICQQGREVKWDAVDEVVADNITCYFPWIEPLTLWITLRASLSGTFLQLKERCRKPLCLEFVAGCRTCSFGSLFPLVIGFHQYREGWST